MEKPSSKRRVQPPIYPRFLQPALRRELAVSPVVLIHGPRQCGKTTLARLFERRRYIYINFDDDYQLNAARDNPKGYVQNLPRRVILDEVQRVPELFRAIKLSVDNDRVPGRFIITGSANVLLLPRLGDSLAGRMSILDLYPLGQAELAGTGQSDRRGAKAASAFLRTLLNGKFKPHTRGRHLGKELARRIAAGGYPAALARGEGGRPWYRQYARLLVQRDIRELGRIHALDHMPRLLQLAAGQSAQLINYSDLAKHFRQSAQTIRQYLTLLENIFLIDILPPWHVNYKNRLVKTPKLHIGDTGLACALLGLSAEKLWQRKKLLGSLLETFVYRELRKQAGWQEAEVRFSHFRDKNQLFEVDVVLECADKIFGLEVKLSSGLQPGDFKGLHRLREAAGKRFGGGVLLHDGDTVLPFRDKMAAVPISLLWEAGVTA